MFRPIDFMMFFSTDVARVPKRSMRSSRRSNWISCRWWADWLATWCVAMDWSGLALVAPRSNDAVWAVYRQKLGLTASCHEPFGRVWVEAPFQSAWSTGIGTAAGPRHLQSFSIFSVLLSHDTFFIGRLHRFLGTDVQWQYVRPGVMLKERVAPDGLNDSRWGQHLVFETTTFEAAVSPHGNVISGTQIYVTTPSPLDRKMLRRRCTEATCARQSLTFCPLHSLRFRCSRPHEISLVSLWSTISWLLAVFTDNFCKYALGVSRPGWPVVCVTLLEILTAFLGLSVRFAL